jgi:hypothetical protein
VAIDETWLRSYEPKFKSQSSELAHSRVAKANLKQLTVIAYDNGGVMASDYAPHGHTVNRKYYETFLKEKLRPAIRKK